MKMRILLPSFFTLLPSVCWLMNLPNLNCVTLQRLLIWWLCLVSMWQRFKPNIFSVFSHFKPFSLFSQQHDFSFSTGIMEDAKSQVYPLSLEWCHWCLTLKKKRGNKAWKFYACKIFMWPFKYSQNRAQVKRKCFMCWPFSTACNFCWKSNNDVITFKLWSKTITSMNQNFDVANPISLTRFQ